MSTLLLLQLVLFQFQKRKGMTSATIVVTTPIIAAIIGESIVFISEA
jgi:hypothetical protein